MRRVSPEHLKERLLAEGVLETAVHRQFAGGQHGLKLHLDMVVRGSRLYREILRAKTELVKQVVPPANHTLIIMGIADGTNQESLDLADMIGGKTIGVETQKLKNRQVALTALAKRILLATRPNLVILNEDVGTAGTVCASVVPRIRSLGIDDITAIHTWQRQQSLPRLDEVGVKYHPVIYEELPMFSPAECRASGYCADNVPFER